MPKRIQLSTSKYRIHKESTEDTKSESDTDSKSNLDTNSTTSGYSSEGGSKYKYNSLVNSTYKKSRTGSIQDNLSKDQIREKLQGYKALKSTHDKKQLLQLKPFKVWIRYFNTITTEFRVGGLLKIVDPELRYIMLVNTIQKLTWSVQLKDCIIFIPKDIQEKELEKQKEEITKEKLYKLYNQGKLARK